MNLFKLLLVIAVLGGGYQLWHQHQADLRLAALTDDVGFTAVPAPSGFSERGVVIFAPENCPSEAAQRAEALAGALADAGVVVRRAHAADFDDLPDAETADRIGRVMSGPVPVVFVNGKAKANPSLADVLREYRGKANSAG